MPDIITRCPQCDAQYKLTPEQLSIAGGKVRCGACMTVFQASPAPVRSGPSEVKKPPTANAKTQRSIFVNEDDDKLLNELDDVLIDDDMDIAPIRSQSSKTTSDMEFSPEFDQVLRENDLYDEVDSVKALSEDESWAERLLEEASEGADEAAPTKAKRTPFGGEDLSKDTEEDDPFALDLEGLDISLELTEDEEESLGAFSKDDLRGRIQSEPLEFALASRKSLLMNIALGLVALMALAGLAGQLLYFQFDSLARTAKWRDTYATICQYANCTLPEAYNIDDIRASQLTVKSHPHYSQALMVDAIVINQADKAQPFPNVELFFTDIQGDVVAARRFAPEDYLRGELRHAQLMPKQQPIRFALELDDPGSQASGYWVQLGYKD